MRTILLAALFVLASGAAQAAGPVGTTILSYDRGHGTQVEFLRKGGSSFLWYPGNAVVLPGQWKSTGGPGGPQQMCFKYGANSYNPVTHVQGAVWECEPLSIYVATLEEQQRGDVFGLAQRKAVPFTLSRARTTIEQLAAEPGANAQLGEVIHLRK